MSKCGIEYEKFKVRLVEKLNKYFNGTSILDEEEEKIKIQMKNEKIVLIIPFDKIEEAYNSTEGYTGIMGLEDKETKTIETIINLSEERLLEHFMEEFIRRIRKDKNVD